MVILSLDTSGKLASCALLRDDELVAQKVQDTQLDHSRLLLPLCADLLKETGIALKDVDLFAAVAGPGSFTGLRIGVAAVKGFAWPLNKPCLGVSSLEAMAFLWEGQGKVCCSLYARPGERYFAVFRRDGERVVRLTPDRVGTQEELAAEMDRLDCREQLEDCQSAAGGAKAALYHFQQGERQSCHTILPAYLRVPQAERLRKERLNEQ